MAAENESENVTESDETQAETVELTDEVEPTVEAESAAPEAEVEAAEEPADEPEAEPMAAEAAPAAAELVEEAPAEPAAAEAEPAAEPEGLVAEAAVVPTKAKKKRLPRSERSQRTKKKRERATERKPIARLPKPEHERGRRQERQGTVVSAAADKTIVVRVDVVKVHPTYKKVIKRSTKFHAHDERNEAKPGDVVRIVETRPLSKMKRWRLQEIVEAAK